MSSFNDGGPAFPHPTAFTGYTVECNTGVTKREWLAGQALAGMCANSEAYQAPADKVAAWCVQYADYTLAELAKEKEP